MFSLLHCGRYVCFVLLILITKYHNVCSDIVDDSDLILTYENVKNDNDSEVLLLYNISHTDSEIIPINVVVDEDEESLVVGHSTQPSVLEKNGSTSPVLIVKNTENVADAETKVTTLKLARPTTLPDIYIPSKPERNNTCHNECVSALEEMTFVRIPDDFYLEKGTSLTLECSIPLNENYSAVITWLFQGVSPPVPQCSLTTQETLPSCPNFALKDHFIDVNYTAGYMKEILILKELDLKDSGHYICMVELTCCSASHIMDKSIQTEQPIVIYYENYRLELGILCGIIVFLALLIVIGTILQNRHRKRFIKIDISEVKRPILDDVLHIPILERKDSFDDSDQEWDDDKG